nr:TSUP family transporter [Lichenihabitans sp. PAMC28606]
MPIINAIGATLLAVGCFGLATALNYASSGPIDGLLAAEFMAGGIIGGLFGTWLATRLSARTTVLGRIFGLLVLVVAADVIVRN